MSALSPAVVHFLYGSQTGNSESIAQMLLQASKAAENLVDGGAACCTLNDAEKMGLFNGSASLQSPSRLTMVIVCSTTGNADFPDNAQRFKRLLKRASPQALSLSHIRYTVLALGDTNYDTFCAAGKYIDNRLEELGAVRFYRRGEADDGTGLEIVVAPWCTGLWEALRNSAALATRAVFDDTAKGAAAATSVAIVFSGDAASAVLATELYGVLVSEGGSLPCTLIPLRVASSAFSDVLFTASHVVWIVFEASPTTNALLKAAASVALGPETCHAPFCASSASLELLGALATPSAPPALRLLLPNKLPALNNSLADADLFCSTILDKLVEPMTTQAAQTHSRRICDTVWPRGNNAGSSPSIHPLPLPFDNKSFGEHTPTDRSSLVWLKPVVALFFGDEAAPPADMARHLRVAAESRSVNLAVTRVSDFKSTGFPRHAAFLFLLGTEAKKAEGKFFKFLAAAAPSDSFKAVHFGILSLDVRRDDSAFHEDALLLERELLRLGATKSHATGLAELHPQAYRRGDVDLVAMRWMDLLWPNLQSLRPVLAGWYIDSGLSTTVAGLEAVPQNAAQWFTFQRTPVLPEVAARCPIHIFHSGTGPTYAAVETLVEAAEKQGFTSTVEVFKHLPGTDVGTIRFAFFICGTTSAGELCGGTSLLRFLRNRNNAPDLFSHVYFVSFGIGTSAHDHPCHYLAEQLESLGARRTMSVCIIPTLSLITEVALPWMTGVLGAFAQFQRRFDVAAARIPASKPLLLLPKDRRSVLFLYCGDSLAAQDVALELHDEALMHGFASRIASLQDFQHMRFTTTRFLVFVTGFASTTSPPHNAQRFVKYIGHRSLGPTHLSDVNYTVLAIDNSLDLREASAADGADVGHYIDYRLAEVGAVCFHPLTVASERDGLEKVIEPWRKALVDTMYCSVGVAIPSAAGLLTAKNVAASSPNTAVAVRRSPMMSASTSQIVVPEMPLAAESLLILFGSQQGNAEAIAKTLATKAAEQDYECDIAPLNQFEKKEWRKKSKILLIVMSTTGDGEFPDNATAFARFIRQKSHPADLLCGVRYAVLALGDTNYTKFCQAGRFVDRRMEELGARRIYARVDCDDAFDLATYVEPWIDSLWGVLEAQFAIPSAPRPPSTAGEKTSETESSSTAKSFVRSRAETSEKHYSAKIKDWYYMTAEELPQQVIHLTLSVSSVNWNPGDAVSFMPPNSDGDVDWLLARLKTKGEEPLLPPSAAASECIFSASPVYSHLVFPISKRDVLQHFVTFRIYNNKTILQVLVANTSDSTERNVLKSWCSQQSVEWKQKLSERISIIDLLTTYKSCNPPFRHVVEHLMPMQPRYYSIASAHSKDPTTLTIAFKIVEKGLCTNWLHQLCLSTEKGFDPEISFAIRKTPEFRLPADNQIPLILIGPGTGVAPFISFLEHREATRSVTGGKLGETHLFFGCRHPDVDYLFRDELEEFERSKALSNLYTAFSQDTNAGMWYGGCYVQDRIQHCATHICSLLLNSSAHLYVCGDADGMARDVHAMLVDIMEQYTNDSPAECQAQLAALMEEGRYQRDIWA